MQHSEPLDKGCCDAIQSKHVSSVGRSVIGNGPAFPNRFAAGFSCIRFGYHAAFIVSLVLNHDMSGVRLSRAV
jgi:hypothetical protein